MRKMRDHRGVRLKPIHEAGEPIPREISSRFTQPKEIQPLFQVHVDVKGEPLPYPVGPKIGQEAAEMILVAVNSQIALGKLPTWGNARLEPITSH